MISHRVAAGLAVLAVILTTVVGGVAIADSTQQSSGEDYTLDELQQDGTHQAVPSARIVPTEQRVYWLEHRAVNKPWQDVTPSSNGEKLAEDGMVKTNSIYLRTIRAQSTSESMNVTLVFYNEATREVTRGNTTTTEEVAENVSVINQQVTMQAGWSVAEIDLPQHSQKKQMTIWLDEHPDTARWTSEHKSVATTQPIDVNNWSEFILLGSAFIILPSLGFGWYGGRKVKSMIVSAGAPPGHGFAYYTIIATLATMAIMYWAYYYAAEVIVTMPIVLGAYVAAVYVGYMFATHEGKTERKLLWQPHIQSVDAFSDTKIPSVGSGNDSKSIEFSEDMPFGQMQIYQFLDEGQDGLSVVRDGWLAFLARVKGGRAKVENAHELKTRFSTWNSPWSEVFLVDPEADTLIDYEPPGLALKTPEIDEWSDLVWPVTLIGGGGYVAWQAAQSYGPAAWTVLLVTIPFFVWKFAVTGTDSHVEIDPAPAALRSVVASMMVMNIGNRDAKGLQEAEEFAWDTLAQSNLDIEALKERRNRTVTERILGEDLPDDDHRSNETTASSEDDDDSSEDSVTTGEQEEGVDRVE